MTKTANGLDVDHVGRLHELHWCTVARNGVPLFEGLPREVIHDTGDRMWFFVSYYEEPFPPEVTSVTDGHKTHDAQGNFVISVPVEWCSLIEEEEAETILRCGEVDEQIKGYMN